MILLPLLATAVALVEPNPQGFQRLQPRSVTATSFLKNGWNQFEQNYLPPYVADDDPQTAWVEGATSTGTGESLTWVGPRLKKARTFKVYLRAGYQKSQALYKKNGRPRRIQIAPVLVGSDDVKGAGNPVEVELADQLGWQEVVVPTSPSVNGVRITMLSVYPGSTYEDTCVSDLRVYVQGDDPYRPEVEAAAGEAIRKFAAERRRAASERGNRASIAWPPTYTEQRLVRTTLKETPGPGTSVEDLFKRFGKTKTVADVLPKVLAAAKLFDSLRTGDSVSPPVGWTKIRLSLLPRGDGGAGVAFHRLDRQDGHFSDRVLLLHKKDHAAFAARSGKGEDNSAWVRGDVGGYEALVRATSREVGERETTTETRHELILYQGDLAQVVVTWFDRWEKITVACHLLRWTQAERPVLSEVITLVSEHGTTPYEEDAASELRAYRFWGPDK